MIDQELAAFIEEGLGIEICTRSARLEPNGAHVVAAFVENGGTHVVAYVPERAARPLLPDLESNGQAALVFVRPPDERACQIKGTFEGARVATDADRVVVEAQWERWLDRLMTVGVARPVFGHWTTWPCLAIRVRVHAIFNQTPGPGAGGRLA